jgi:hypothetical protein
MIRRPLQLLIFLSLFPVADIFCQAEDSLPATVKQGIVSVRRRPVPAAFRATVSTSYISSSGQGHFDFSWKEIVYSDSSSLFYPPQPYDWPYETPKTDADPERDYPRGDYDWSVWLKTIDYSFAWSDSARSDSAQFEFTIGKKGDVSIRAIPWPKADSTCRAFEAAARKRMMTRTSWYPARRRKNERSRKMKNVKSIVIVTVYAYDPTKGRLLPIEGIEK